jgi:hypothetical protein
LESGEYDLVSDRVWVAKCEGIAGQARLERKRMKATSIHQSDKSDKSVEHVEIIEPIAFID